MIDFYLVLSDPNPPQNAGQATLGPFSYVLRKHPDLLLLGLTGSAFAAIFGGDDDGRGMREHGLPIIEGRLQVGAVSYGAWRTIDEYDYEQLTIRPVRSAGLSPAAARTTAAGFLSLNLNDVAAILRSEDQDLRRLAAIGGCDPRTMFIGTNLDGTDLRGQDLSGMILDKLDEAKVLSDDKTIWPADRRRPEAVRQLQPPSDGID